MRREKVLFQAIESLEPRRLLATITVTSTADTVTPNDGAVTLREAIRRDDGDRISSEW